MGRSEPASTSIGLCGRSSKTKFSSWYALCKRPEVFYERLSYRVQTWDHPRRVVAVAPGSDMVR